MTQLEDALVRGMKVAHQLYFRMSDGYWLHHAPEHFIQIVLSIEITKRCGYPVFPDISFKKTKSEIEILEEKTGQRTSTAYCNLSQRPDLLIWRKTTGAIYAVIELKRAWTVSPLRKDALKISEALKSELEPEAGYILAYSDAGENHRTKHPVELLEKRFHNWSDQLKWSLIEFYISQPAKNKNVWGFCLLKCKEKK